MKKKKKWIILLLVLIVVTCAGCMTPADIYEASRKYEATDEELKALAEGKLTMSYDKESFDSYIEYLKYWAASLVVSWSDYIKAYAIPLMAVSGGIGLILMGLGKRFRAMSLRRVGVFVFLIGIPAFIICLIYASAFFADAIS